MIIHTYKLENIFMAVRGKLEKRLFQTTRLGISRGFKFALAVIITRWIFRESLTKLKLVILTILSCQRKPPTISNFGTKIKQTLRCCFITHMNNSDEKKKNSFEEKNCTTRVD